jgi:SNF2 family DNA or RNA helicase
MTTKSIFSDPGENPRVQGFLNLVDEAIEDEQCIVFCKYQSEIIDLETVLDRRESNWAEFTGRVPGKKRTENLEDFRSGKAQFLLANKMCGAYGLNLQFCHNIIFYSNDFDYATRVQAEDRIHRIGQKEVSKIYDIEGIGTIDDFIAKNLGGKTTMVSAFKALIGKWKKAKNEDLKKAGQEGMTAKERNEKGLHNRDRLQKRS